MILYRELSTDEVEIALFEYFDRTQTVTRCWRKVNGKWLIKDIAFTDNWSELSEVLKMLAFSEPHLCMRAQRVAERI